jgi:hypothetical protein
MIQRRQGARLLFEPPDAFGVVRPGATEHLDCDLPIKTGIASPVDLAHATRAEWSEYLVSSKRGSCSKGHVLETDYSVGHLIDRLRT